MTVSPIFPNAPLIPGSISFTNTISAPRLFLEHPLELIHSCSLSNQHGLAVDAKGGDLHHTPVHDLLNAIHIHDFCIDAQFLDSLIYVLCKDLALGTACP